MKKLLSRLIFLYAGGAGLLTAAPVYAADPAPGWRVEVYAPGLPFVDNLALAAEGQLYASLERGLGRGRVVRIRNGVAEAVLSDLNRPDGLLAHDDVLYITEEVSKGRVLAYNLRTRSRRTLATLHNPEGIGRLPGGDLVVTEDHKHGRLLRLPAAGAPVVLLDQLNRPEGLSVGKDGAIYFAETATGKVRIYKNGNLFTVIDRLNEPDQVRLDATGALWITEDAKPGRLLRYRDGKLEVIVSGLDFPQGMVFMADGALLLAEQGRGRILAIRRAR